MAAQQREKPESDKRASQGEHAVSEMIDTIRIGHEAGYPVIRQVLKTEGVDRNEITRAALEDLGVSTVLENGKKLEKVTLVCNGGMHASSTLDLEFVVVEEGKFGIMLGPEATILLLLNKKKPEAFLGVAKHLRKVEPLLTSRFSLLTLSKWWQ